MKEKIPQKEDTKFCFFDWKSIFCLRSTFMNFNDLCLLDAILSYLNYNCNQVEQAILALFTTAPAGAGLLILSSTTPLDLVNNMHVLFYRLITAFVLPYFY